MNQAILGWTRDRSGRSVPIIGGGAPAIGAAPMQQMPQIVQIPHPMQLVHPAAMAAMAPGGCAGGFGWPFGLPMDAQAFLRERFSGPGLPREEANHQREYPLGLTSTGAVAAGTTVTITAQPQLRFKGERFVVGSSIARFFSLVDLKIGQKSQLVSAGAVPCEVFAEDGVGVRLLCDTADAGILITATVTNTDVVAHPFSGALIGPALT